MFNLSLIRLNSEAGMAMMVTLFIAVLGSILLGSYMNIIMQESKHSVWQKQRAQSLFLAEAGVEKGLYYLNNRGVSGNPWVNEQGQIKDTPLSSQGYLASGNYEISLHDRNEMSFLPEGTYLMKSAGIIPRTSSEDIEHRISCIVSKLKGLSVPAALAIMDAPDPEEELVKFESAVWTVDGRDHKESDGELVPGPNIPGVPAIAVANDGGDNIPGQLGKRIDQVFGADQNGVVYQGQDAIVEDSGLFVDLSAYVTYFIKVAIDISGMGTIPSEHLGTSDKNQILYADLSHGDLKLAGNDTGYGILVLEGDGEFEMAGNSTWNGVIICAGNSNTRLKGGGWSPAHILGALLIANGIVEVNGTADVKYSSAVVNRVNANLLLYQVYSWCGGWGTPIGG